MTMSSTNVVQSHIGTITFANPVNNIEAHFLYPKVVIIEDRRKVTIIDIECEFNNETSKTFVFDLDEDITDNILLEHLLWLTLKSYVLVVINIKTGTLVNIRCNNYANYKICQFYRLNNNLVLMSESGECLALPFSTTELDNNMKQSENDMVVTLEKLHISRSALKSQETVTLLSELNAYIEYGKVILQCSITGTIDVLSTDPLLEYIVPWTNSLIIANKSNMWMIDLRDFSTTYQFSNEVSKYYPLKAVDKTFYYILWDKEQVQVKSASICHSENNESEASDNIVTSKTTQDNLKVQLNTLVSSITSNIKPAQVVSILSLNKDLQTARDMICSNAVKQTMTSRTKSEEATPSSKENEPWRLTSREEPLLRTAHKCVRHIANMEWAGACLFYVLQGCARGADQVAAAHLCFQFSQRWATLQPGNRALRQMERLYATLSTRHALHNIDWACEEFIRLSTEPAQLIHAMYLHPDFVDKIARYDVNRAANEIADKNNINISTIRIQILENLLQKGEKETETLPGLNTKELITAKYILKATCSKMAAIYLSRIALDEECEFNKCKKLRAFQCLMSVVDPDTAVKVTNRERESLWSLLLELLYVVNLEKIDMPWVVATFVQDKLHALQQLLQVANGNIEGLKIAAALALRYGDALIIRELIPLLVRASLHDEVIPLLLKCCHLLDEVIYTAWRAVMLTPFQRADYPITERQKKKCLKVLNLLPVCPLIKDEDLLEIWKHCVRCKCLGLGCLILPYMTSQTRQKLTELQKIDRRNLIISIKNLHAESYLVPGAMIALENLGSKTHR
ncbi:Kinetochore-associated protein 1 [Papilio machaon]|uniref:Kinetochore-associated protein 1 n=1 Tax=Papilio machaon TaxID=76193 RepID=A0A194RL02_PAPMA|nr:Kinetochore-associated protein 1 [Papilio machaon]